MRCVDNAYDNLRYQYTLCEPWAALQKQRQGNGQTEQPHRVPRGADQPGGTHRYGKIGKTKAEQCAGRRRTVADSSAKIVNRQSTAARHSARALLGLLSHHCAM